MEISSTEWVWVATVPWLIVLAFFLSIYWEWSREK